MGKLDEKFFLDLSYVVNINTLAKHSYLPCDDNMDYHFDDCLAKKVVENLVEKFGCSLPYLPKISNVRNLAETSLNHRTI